MNLFYCYESMVDVKRPKSKFSIKSPSSLSWTFLAKSNDCLVFIMQWSGWAPSSDDLSWNGTVKAAQRGWKELERFPAILVSGLRVINVSNGLEVIEFVDVFACSTFLRNPYCFEYRAVYLWKWFHSKLLFS